MEWCQRGLEVSQELNLAPEEPDRGITLLHWPIED